MSDSDETNESDNREQGSEPEEKILPSQEDGGSTTGEEDGGSTTSEEDNVTELQNDLLHTVVACNARIRAGFLDLPVSRGRNDIHVLHCQDKQGACVVYETEIRQWSDRTRSSKGPVEAVLFPHDMIIEVGGQVFQTKLDRTAKGARMFCRELIIPGERPPQWVQWADFLVDPVFGVMWSPNVQWHIESALGAFASADISPLPLFVDDELKDLPVWRPVDITAAKTVYEYVRLLVNHDIDLPSAAPSYGVYSHKGQLFPACCAAYAEWCTEQMDAETYTLDGFLVEDKVSGLRQPITGCLLDVMKRLRRRIAILDKLADEPGDAYQQVKTKGGKGKSVRHIENPGYAVPFTQTTRSNAIHKVNLRLSYIKTMNWTPAVCQLLEVKRKSLGAAVEEEESQITKLERESLGLVDLTVEQLESNRDWSLAGAQSHKIGLKHLRNLAARNYEFRHGFLDSTQPGPRAPSGARIYRCGVFILPNGTRSSCVLQVGVDDHPTLVPHNLIVSDGDGGVFATRLEGSGEAYTAYYRRLLPCRDDNEWTSNPDSEACKAIHSAKVQDLLHLAIGAFAKTPLPPVFPVGYPPDLALGEDIWDYINRIHPLLYLGLDIRLEETTFYAKTDAHRRDGGDLFEFEYLVCEFSRARVAKLLQENMFTIDEYGNIGATRNDYYFRQPVYGCLMEMITLLGERIETCMGLCESTVGAEMGIMEASYEIVADKPGYRNMHKCSCELAPPSTKAVPSSTGTLGSVFSLPHYLFTPARAASPPATPSPEGTPVGTPPRGAPIAPTISPPKGLEIPFTPRTPLRSIRGIHIAPGATPRTAAVNTVNTLSFQAACNYEMRGGLMDRVPANNWLHPFRFPLESTPEMERVRILHCGGTDASRTVSVVEMTLPAKCTLQVVVPHGLIIAIGDDVYQYKLEAGEPCWRQLRQGGDLAWRRVDEDNPICESPVQCLLKTALGAFVYTGPHRPVELGEIANPAPRQSPSDYLMYCKDAEFTERTVALASSNVEHQSMARRPGGGGGFDFRYLVSKAHQGLVSNLDEFFKQDTVVVDWDGCVVVKFPGCPCPFRQPVTGCMVGVVSAIKERYRLYLQLPRVVARGGKWYLVTTGNKPTWREMDTKHELLHALEAEGYVHEYRKETSTLAHLARKDFGVCCSDFGEIRRALVHINMHLSYYHWLGWIRGVDWLWLVDPGSARQYRNLQLRDEGHSAIQGYALRLLAYIDEHLPAVGGVDGVGNTRWIRKALDALATLNQLNLEVAPPAVEEAERRLLAKKERRGMSSIWQTLDQARAQRETQLERGEQWDDVSDKDLQVLEMLARMEDRGKLPLFSSVRRGDTPGKEKLNPLLDEVRGLLDEVWNLLDELKGAQGDDDQGLLLQGARGCCEELVELAEGDLWGVHSSVLEELVGAMRWASDHHETIVGGLQGSEEQAENLERALDTLRGLVERARVRIDRESRRMETELEIREWELNADQKQAVVDRMLDGGDMAVQHAAWGMFGELTAAIITRIRQ